MRISSVKKVTTYFFSASDWSKNMVECFDYLKLSFSKTFGMGVFRFTIAPKFIHFFLELSMTKKLQGFVLISVNIYLDYFECFTNLFYIGIKDKIKYLFAIMHFIVLHFNLSNSGAFTELRTTAFIYSMRVASSNFVDHNRVQVFLNCFNETIIWSLHVQF